MFGFMNIVDKVVWSARDFLKLRFRVLRAAACKNRELHFSDHLVEFLIFRLKIPLD